MPSPYIREPRMWSAGENCVFSLRRPLGNSRKELASAVRGAGPAMTDLTDACSKLLVDSVPRSELLRITQLQSEMSRPPPATQPARTSLACLRALRSHQALRTANEELEDYNCHAAEQHAALSGRFSQHAQTLNAVQADLMNVFRRIRAIKQKLLHDNPELQAAAQEHDAKQERELEARLEQVQSRTNQLSL